MKQKYTQNAQDGAHVNYKFTPEKIDQFLKHLASNGNVSMSARLVGMSRRSIYAYAKRNPTFRETMQEARAEAHDLIYAESWRRAVQGVEKPVFYQGQVCGVVKQYSDKLLGLLLRNQFGLPYSNDEDDLYSQEEHVDKTLSELDLSKLTDVELDVFSSLINKCTSDANTSV